MWRGVLIWTFVLLMQSWVYAQDLQEARALRLRGNYSEAIEKYAKLGEAHRSEAVIGTAQCLKAQGEYEKAGEALAEALKAEKTPGVLAELADLQFLLGEYEEAAHSAEEALKLDDRQLLARWVRARVLCEMGKYAEADKQHEWFIHYYNEVQPTDPESLLLVAQAAAEFARWNKLPDEFDFILNELLVDANSDPDFWQASWYAGMLLLEKYNRAEGVPELKKALQINPSAADAYVGLGTASLQGYDFAEGFVFADQALAINPRHPGALRLKADLLLADSRTDEALETLQQAIKVNPISQETLGRLAAAYYLKGETDLAEQIKKEVLERNPQPGVFYDAAADQLEKRRQFALAQQYYQDAIEAAPHLAGPLNGLGMLYMRVGKEDEAREIFAKARELDPFHVRVLNMVKVLKHMEDYKVIRSEHYDVIVREDKDGMLGEYMSEYLERTHADLCKRFGYEPKDRVKIEVLMNHQWFSARVIGLPRVGTVGACTGDVVAMASPQSLKNPYNWARVLTHEVTHVITLQQTGYNIPHWFTEALAVQSEGYPRPQVWNELLVERVPKRDLFNLDNINHAFVRPKTPLDWQMAYCQSLLYAQYMIAKFGEDSIAKLLAAYGENIETPQAIEKVFGIGKDEFEAGYVKFLDDLVAEMKVDVGAKEMSFAEAERAVRNDPENPDLTAELALHHFRRKNNAEARKLAQKALELKANHPLALYILAQMEMSIGKYDEAFAILQPGLEAEKPDLRLVDLLAAIHIRRKDYDKAGELYTMARERDPLETKWVEGLARVYLLNGDKENLARVLEELARMDSDDLAVRLKLAQLAQEREDWPAAEQWAQETLYVDVANAEAHQILATAAEKQDKLELAEREYTAGLTLAPKDQKLALQLAKICLRRQNNAKARQLLEQILQSDPDHEEAKDLLEKAGKS